MIICLAWGSLVWDPREFKSILASEWYNNGPEIPLEFARQSNNDRLTLVIGDNFKFFPALWAHMSTTDIKEAIESLRKREQTIQDYIGVWYNGNPTTTHS